MTTFLTRHRASARYLAAILGLAVVAYGAVQTEPAGTLAWALLAIALTAAALAAIWLSAPLLTSRKANR